MADTIKRFDITVGTKAGSPYRFGTIGLGEADLFGPRIAMAFGVFISLAVGSSAQSRPDRAALPLDEERLNVYRAYLDVLGPALHVKHLANRTAPLDFKGFPETRPCLKGIELENLSEETHGFSPEITKGRALNLVDRREQLKLIPRGAGPKAELNFLIFSEIVFDKTHQFAVLRYLLICGDHCDSGATRVMEKVDGHWTVSSRVVCAGFVNNSWSELPD